MIFLYAVEYPQTTGTTGTMYCTRPVAGRSHGRHGYPLVMHIANWKIIGKAIGKWWFHGISWDDDHLVMTNSLRTGKSQVIVDLPIEDGDFPVRYVNVYQRVLI